MSLQDKVGIQRELRQSLAQHVAIPVITGGPDNAVVADTAIADTTLALLNDGDTISLDGNTWEYNGGGTADFDGVVELVALIDALPRWAGNNAAGTAEIESDNGGEAWNQYAAVMRHLADTTANGAVATQADATITAAAFAELAVGDTIVFAGETFTRAAATSVPANEFLDIAGLAACIDALTDWDGSVPVADCLIESTADGTEWNGYEVWINYRRQLENGANGTPGVAGGICVDDAGAELWVSLGTAGLSNASWTQIV